MAATVAPRVAPALKALLENFIDYAGIYPPATLSLEKAIANYEQYKISQHSWMLRWLVVNSSDMAQLPNRLDGCLSVLSEGDDARAASIETKSIVKASHPVYCEVSVKNTNELSAVQQSGCLAKIRTGGVKPEAIPSPAEVATFISTCADLKLPFKATAGLHHPIRAEYALTYEPEAPRAVMHGFLNIAMASALAWHGERLLEPVIAETDATAFSFDEKAHWRGKALTVDQLKSAREYFMHSVGSCSFDEPVSELQALGLLS